jgi:LPXTG-motif cell wall-anchored protein
MGNTDLVFEATWAESDGADSNEDADLNDGTDDTETDVAIPDTGSVAGGLAAFAVISGAAAAAYVYVRKKRED